MSDKTDERGTNQDDGGHAAKIITIFNQKGGSGKTTVTMHLGAALAEKGAKVMVIDTDPQGSASRWANAASVENPFPAHVIELTRAGSKLYRDLEGFYDAYDHILVDCPPSVDSAAVQSALSVADLALIPFVPSPMDAWAVTHAKTLLDRAQIYNKALKVRLVVNNYTRTNLSDAVSEMVKETQGIEVLKTWLSARTSYRECSAIGGSVLSDAGDHKAQQEVRGFAEEVVEVLNSTEGE